MQVLKKTDKLSVYPAVLIFPLKNHSAKGKNDGQENVPKK